MTKRIMEYCPSCKKDTEHRKKKSCSRRGKDGFSTKTFPDMCYACGYEHGKRAEKEARQRSTHLSVSK